MITELHDLHSSDEMDITESDRQSNSECSGEEPPPLPKRTNETKNQDKLQDCYPKSPLLLLSRESQQIAVSKGLPLPASINEFRENLKRCSLQPPRTPSQLIHTAFDA